MRWNLGLKQMLAVFCSASILALLLRYHSTIDVTLVHKKPMLGLPRLRESIIEVKQRMSNSSADKNFFKFLSKRHLLCETDERFGNALDGGWEMCLDEPYRPKSPCLVYSFGINDDFSFDDAISDNFNCKVRSFDPSMTVTDHQRSKNVWFYKIGIAGEDKINKKTLSTIIKFMNDTDVVIDYLKIDVDGSEWPSLPQMLSSGTLANVKQLGIELHTDSIRLDTTYKLLRQLEEQGFRRWYYSLNLYHVRKTANGFRSCCYEMVYVNNNFLKQNFTGDAKVLKTFQK